MDDVTNLIRIIVTVGSFVLFLLIAFWAYSKAAKHNFDEAANLPFGDDADKMTAGGATPPATNGAKQ